MVREENDTSMEDRKAARGRPPGPKGATQPKAEAVDETA